MKTPEELAHYYADRLHKRIAHSDVFVEGFLAGYQAATPQWISVKDRLPDEEEWVLVDSYDVVQRIKRPLVGLKKATNGRITGTYKWKTTFGLYVELVSFWMPLPKPPEE